MNEVTSRKSTGIRVLTMMLVLMMMLSTTMLSTISVGFCVDTDTVVGAADSIEGAVSGLTEQIYKTMRAIILPLVICFLAYAGFQFLAGGTQGPEKARKVVIGCLFALAFVVFAPMIAKEIGSWLGSSGKGSWDSYNNL